MSEFEKIKQAAQKGSFEAFIDKIKGLPVFGVYEIAVMNGDKEDTTAGILQISTLLATMDDEEFHMLMMKLSHDLLFAMADQRLRNEILEENN